MCIIPSGLFTRCLRRTAISGLVLGLYLAFAPVAFADGSYGGPYSFGTPATPQEIARVDIDVMPDGRGLPSGQGGYAQGQIVYEERCSACHGDKMQGEPWLGGAALIGGRDSLTSGQPKRTVESYWPYATTLFDYLRRAMPFDEPGVLTDDEVYALVAYVLSEAKIIDQNTVMDAETLPKVEMPNHSGFISDARPDVFNYD